MTTCIWLGAGNVTREQLRWEITGTWAAADTASFTINGKTLTLTVGTTYTVDQVGADLEDMINGADANSDEGRSALGSAVGEFANLTASYSASANKITLTGDDTGRPIGTVTVASTTAGDGTITADATGTVAAVSPNHFSNAQNWSGGVPADNDDVVFDNNAVASCLYDLSPSSLTPTSLTVTRGFRYSIGLPEVNSGSGVTFDEHLATYLTIDGCATVIIDAANANKIKLNTGATIAGFQVRSTGQTDEPNVPPVLLKVNKNTSTLSVQGGSVGVNYEPKTTGSLASVSVNGQSPSVEIGDTTTLVTLNVSSGTVTSNSAVTTINQSGGSIVLNAGAVTTLNCDGGFFSNRGAGTITTLYLNGGTLDCSSNSTGRAITNTIVYAKSAIKDPLGSINFGANGFDLYCKPQDVILDLPARRTYVISAV
jgi:hypothetical protein